MAHNTDDFVDAALRVIVSEGTAGLSYRHVAQEAGWSVGAMQKAFPRKTDLLLAVMTRVNGPPPRPCTRSAVGPPPGTGWCR